MSQANESCASSSSATDDTVMRSPSRNAPSPLPGPPAHAERGRRRDPDDQLARAFEPDQRRPDRHAADVALGAVDGVDDPPELGRRHRRLARSPVAVLLAEHRVAGRAASRARIARSTAWSASLTGVRSGLVVDLQIVGPEAVHRDARRPGRPVPGRVPAPRRCPRAEHTGARERADGDAMDGMVGVVARRDDVMAQICELVRASDPARRRRVRARLLRTARRRRPRHVDDRRARRAPRSSTGASARSVRPSEALVRVYTPAHGHTAVDVVLDDMPFLVDSLTMALDRRNLGVHLVVHPILCVRRTTPASCSAWPPRPTSVHSDRDGDKSLLESWTHIEIDRETSTEILDAVRADLLAVLARRARRDPRLAADARTRCTPSRTSSNSCRRRARPTTSPRARRSCSGSPTSTSRSSGTARTTSPTTTSCSRCRARGLGLLRNAPEDNRRRASPRCRPRPGQSAREEPARADEGERALDRAPPDAPRLRRDQALRRATARSSANTASSGLYASGAYTGSPFAVPVLRRKVAAVIERAGFLPASHDQKDLVQILETYPRDDLFQIDVDHLFETAMGILRLQERRRVRLFVHREPYGRFVSCLVFIPRDRYTTQVRERIAQLPRRRVRIDGLRVEHAALGVGARPPALRVAPRHAERRPTSTSRSSRRLVAAAARAWVDDLRDALIAAHGEETGLDVLRVWTDAFPGAYQDDFDAGRGARRSARNSNCSAKSDRSRRASTIGVGSPRPEALRLRRATVAVGGAPPPHEHGRRSSTTSIPYEITPQGLSTPAG